MNWLLSGIMDKKNKARRTNPIEVYKYLRFTENAKIISGWGGKEKELIEFRNVLISQKKMVSEIFQHFWFFDPLKIQNTQNVVLKKFSILGSSVYAWFEKSTISVKVSLYRGPQKSPKSPISIPHCWEAFLI